MMGNFSSLGKSSIFGKKVLVVCQLEGLNTSVLLKVQFLQEHVSDFFESSSLLFHSLELK